MLDLIKALIKTSLIAIIAVLAAAAVEYQGKPLTRHAEWLVSAVRGSRTLETLKEETSGGADDLIRDAREGAATLQKLRGGDDVARKASEKAGNAARALEEISAKHQKELRDLIEERSGH